MEGWSKEPTIGEPLVRVIYYDLAEWRGKTEEFCFSPRKGIVQVSITYPDGYRHLFNGVDYYYVKDRQCTSFGGEEAEARLVTLHGFDKETVEVVPAKSLDWAYLRMGVWVDDNIFRLAKKRILERE